MKKILFYVNSIFLLTFIILIIFSIKLSAAEPKIISKLNNAFSDIESWILKLSTPAAAVAIGSGIFIKKFSFGDEERLRTGKKIIRTSLFSYGFILATDLNLSAIKNLIN